MTRLKVLLSAYACEPDKGSEPGVGWNVAIHMAEHHDVWVLTRASNRAAIELALADLPDLHPHFVYHDLPAWARFWKKGNRGINLYYYLWQLSAVPLLRRLHRAQGFNVVHHVTFVKYTAPSALAWLDDVPFIWGPVGGGESAPLGLWRTLGWRGEVFEAVRTVARWLFERDPLVRRTARRATVAIGTTAETAVRLSELGAPRVKTRGESAVSQSDIERIYIGPAPQTMPFKFVSIARLLAWKGIHLGLEAFAMANIPDSRYLIVGDGPERARLVALVRSLGIEERVTFLGQVTRGQALATLTEANVLVHPSLHDSGGWVCLEAMAAGRPVICLDLGGPGVQVNEHTGVAVPVDKTAANVVSYLAKAMTRLASDTALREQMARSGRERIATKFTWELQAAWLGQVYAEVLRQQGPLYSAYDIAAIKSTRNAN